MRISNPKTHMGWAIAVLVAMLIGALSTEWSKIDGMPNVISIALGLSSLMLALVAIIQGVSGSSTLQSSLGKIETAAAQAVSATSSVEDAARSLASRTATFDDFPQRFDQLSQQIASISSIPPTSSGIAADRPTTHPSFEEVAAASTSGTIVALRLISRAAETKKPFKVQEVFGAADFTSGLVEGYLIGLRTGGLVNFRYDQGVISDVTSDALTNGNLAPYKLETYPVVGETLRKIDAFFAAG